jgi:hypothetical protein
MKNQAVFLKYLNGSASRRTGKPMGPRAVRDVLSRCDRVERMLGLDLHAELAGPRSRMEAVAEKIRNSADRLGFVGKKKYYYNDFISAVRRYHAFLTGDSDSPKLWSLAPKRRRAR